MRITLRHADLQALDLVALLLERFHDVVVGDRAEQTAVGPRLLRDLDLQALELGGALLRLRQGFGLRLSPARRGGASKCLMFSGGGALRLALRDEEVARVAVLHLDHLAEVAEVGHFSMSITSMLIFLLAQCRSVYGSSARKRALDRIRQLALVSGGRAGDARRDDLAGLVDEVLEDLDVLVVDPFDLLGGEAAELAPAEQRPLALVLLVLAELSFAFTFTSARRWVCFLFSVLR